MKHLLFILFLVFGLQAQAQKISTKAFSSKGITTLIIDGNSVFKITVETAKAKTISIHSTVEGENNEHVVLLTEIESNKLYVSSTFHPLFVGNNDKLSAHKLISIELKIVIPEGLKLLISSDIAQVFLSGNYKYVDAELLNGSFNAEHFYGNLLVNTIHGDIQIQTNKAKVNVATKHGTINKDVITLGKNEISLNSINGDITVIKTE